MKNMTETIRLIKITITLILNSMKTTYVSGRLHPDIEALVPETVKIMDKIVFQKDLRKHKNYWTKMWIFFLFFRENLDVYITH